MMRACAVPKAKERVVGPRFSIIAWGRRRTLNARNAGADEVRVDIALPLRQSKDADSDDDDDDDDENVVTNGTKAPSAHAGIAKRSEGDNETTMTGDQVALLVNEFIAKKVFECVCDCLIECVYAHVYSVKRHNAVLSS
jgi:hypothetical protein